MNALDILQTHFASDPTDTRDYLRSITTWNGRILATNGHWIGVLDAGTEIPAGIEPASVIDPSDFIALIDQIAPTTTTWLPATAVGIRMIPCRTCAATGRCSQQRCEVCAGDCEFLRGTHYYDCQECRGTGKITEIGQGDACTACFGTARKVEPLSLSTIGDQNAVPSGHYIARLRIIGGEIDPRLHRTAKGLPVFLVRFPGGHGLLMPMDRSAPLDIADSDLAPETQPA